MMRRRSRRSARALPSRHGRHGREGRSAVVRPPLPPLETRVDRFDLAVGSTAEFLRGAWEELREVRFEIADLPSAETPTGVPRWSVDATQKRIVLYRLPIERMSRLHQNDEHHRRMIVESCVFRAAAEYLDRDPWDLGPERFRFL